MLPLPTTLQRPDTPFPCPTPSLSPPDHRPPADGPGPGQCPAGDVGHRRGAGVARQQPDKKKAASLSPPPVLRHASLKPLQRGLVWCPGEDSNLHGEIGRAHV